MMMRLLILLFVLIAPMVRADTLMTLDLPAEIVALRAERDAFVQAGAWDKALPLQQVIAKAAIAKGGELHLVALAETVQLIRFTDNLGQSDQALAMAEALWAKVTARYTPYAMQRVEPGLLVADLLAKAGRRAEALPIAMDIARMTEAVMGEDSAATAYTRFQAVLILERMGYRSEAVEAYAKLIPVLEADPTEGAKALAAGVSVRRGRILDKRGDLEGALVDYRRADAIYSVVKGDRHPETLATRRLLARVLFDLGDTAGLKAILDANLATVTEIYGPDGVETADWQRLLARWTQTGGAGPEAALPIMRSALEVLERRLPPGHPLLTEAHFDFAGLLSVVKDWPAAQSEYVKSEAGGETDRKFALDTLSFMQDAGQIDAARMAELALPTLQLAAFGRARGAVDEQTKRLLFSTDQARGLYRQASDLREARNGVEAAISDLASQPRDKVDPVQEAALRRDLVDLTAQINGLMAEVNQLEPGFAALTGDLALTVPEIQALLTKDQVFVLVDHQRHDQEWSIAIAITRDKAEAQLFWQPVADLQGWVTAVRDSVALKLGTRTAAALEDAPAAPAEFPFDAAWQLYRQSFLPVWQVFDEKPDVLVEFRGPMTGLPPHLLLAYEPAPTDSLQTAPFLARYKSITVLPSVAALKTAALAKGRAKAPEPFAGFADPSYDAAAVSPALLADSGEAGANRLRGALAPLPETADEVAEVRGFVAGTGGEVWLGDQASEHRAKTAGLDRFAMLYFATHGLVGGDRSGTTLLTEAALALTPGQGEDGFLTASEIAQMRLAADWVVLSACNTAQGDQPGAEALSGLAQAFLYAGAKALLVSHWPVESRSAAHLMTETFRLRAATPGLSAAEAQRQAMVAMIEGKENPRWAHPAYWAPFVIVGAAE